MRGYCERDLGRRRVAETISDLDSQCVLSHAKAGKFDEIAFLGSIREQTRWDNNLPFSSVDAVLRARNRAGGAGRFEGRLGVEHAGAGTQIVDSWGCVRDLPALAGPLRPERLTRRIGGKIRSDDLQVVRAIGHC